MAVSCRGVGSLDQDADDLLLLAQHLKAEFGSKVTAVADAPLCHLQQRFTQ